MHLILLFSIFKTLISKVCHFFNTERFIKGYNFTNYLCLISLSKILGSNIMNKKNMIGRKDFSRGGQSNFFIKISHR